MKSVNIIIKDKLKDDLKHFAEQVCVGAATYVREALTATAYEAFERFYCHYAPRPGRINTSYEWMGQVPAGVPLKYERTYNVLENEIHKFYENKHNKIIRGGVIISPVMPSRSDGSAAYSMSAEEVLDNILRGYHGLPDNHIDNMVPSPEDIIISKQDELKNNPSIYSKYSINKAKHSSKYGYNYLHW